MSLCCAFVELCTLRRMDIDIGISGDSYSATWFNTAGEQPTKENPFGNVDSL